MKKSQLLILLTAFGRFVNDCGNLKTGKYSGHLCSQFTSICEIQYKPDTFYHRT